MTENKPKFDQKQAFQRLANDFHDLVQNKQMLRSSVENFFDNLLDELTLGIIFDLHRRYKTDASFLDADELVEDMEIDTLFQHRAKKAPECPCPVCHRAVETTEFAKHLAKCMGLSTRRAPPRRAVVYGVTMSDDDEDFAEPRSKKGNKKGKKKAQQGDDDEELTSFRDILRLQEHSNSTSPADSASSSGSTKKREKSKNKKGSKRERRSPSPYSMLD
ncbi:unnamed protein product [Phyllotreta striolata]|uniref:SAGA-associated factor 11 n=1 Tax=Phyllotreta striolata TaxID=444603 RepID=A0A9N9TQ61_PHYSR|nr:unnamed protein product [Phyllotreta striolata]